MFAPWRLAGASSPRHRRDPVRLDSQRGRRSDRRERRLRLARTLLSGNSRSSPQSRHQAIYFWLRRTCGRQRSVMRGRRPTNTGIAIVVALLMWLIGPGAFLLIHGPIFVMAASTGVWLFYVQHQFEDTRWVHEANWNFPQGGAARVLTLRFAHYPALVQRQYRSSSRPSPGESHSILPSAGGLARLPNSPTSVASRFGRASRCVNYSLWDEDAQWLISFRTLGRQLRAGDVRASARLGRGRLLAKGSGAAPEAISARCGRRKRTDVRWARRPSWFRQSR